MRGGAQLRALRATAEAETRAASVAAVLDQTPLAVLVTLVNGALLMALLGQGAFTAPAWIWLALMGGISLLRLGLWRMQSAVALPGRRWEWASIAAAGTAGALWGGGALALWPAAEADQLFWVFVIGGMCAGAAALHYAHLPTALAFILAAGLPVALCFAAPGTERGLTAAAMVLVFLAALAASCRRASRRFADYLWLQLDFARQAAALDEVNVSLRAAIVEHRATEASLRQARRMEAMGQLTGGIAHDVNNLLTVVLGNLALLRRHLEAPADPAGRYLDAAEQAARRGTGLTRRLLDLGRGPAGGAVAVDVAALVAGMEDLLGTALGPGIRVERRVPAGLPPVRVDAGQLELALLNLLLNARDAMPAGGTILLSAARHLPAAEGPAALAAAPHVVLTVADSGQGMDPATLAQATEPFFTTKPAGRGSGLGLSMVQGLAAQAGGQLVLRSAPGQGTEAALWLPAIAGAAMTARPAAAAGGAA